MTTGNPSVSHQIRLAACGAAVWLGALPVQGQLLPVLTTDVAQQYGDVTPALQRTPGQVTQVNGRGDVRAVLGELTDHLPPHVSIDALDIIAVPDRPGEIAVLFSTAESCRLPLLDLGSTFPVLPSDIVAYRPANGQFNLAFRSQGHGVHAGANLDAFAVREVAANLTVVDLYVSFDTIVSLRICNPQTGSCENGALVKPADVVRFEAFQFTERSLEFSTTPGFWPGWNVASIDLVEGEGISWLASFDTACRLETRRQADDSMGLEVIAQGAIVALNDQIEPLAPPILHEGNLPLRQGVSVNSLAIWNQWLAGPASGIPRGSVWWIY